MTVAVVEEFEMVDVDHDDRDRATLGNRTTPSVMHARLERLAIQQSRQAIELGNLDQQFALEERGAIRMLEGVAAGSADYDRANQRERQISGDMGVEQPQE